MTKARTDEVWLQHYAEQAQDATTHRDQLIRQLRGDGHTLRSLAALTGLSHTQIANICQKS